MGLVFCFMFAFFGIIFCAGCSVTNSVSDKNCKRAIQSEIDSERTKRNLFEQKFVMSHIDEERLSEEIFSTEGIQHTFYTCREFLKPVPMCDVFFSNGIDGFVNILSSAQPICQIVKRIMAAERGMILNTDFTRLEHNARNLEAVRFCAMDSRILQLVDKKLMTFGVPPMVYTQGGSDYVWERIDKPERPDHNYYTLKPVQDVTEFYNYVEDYKLNGSFKWLNCGTYSSGERRYAGIGWYNG